jgi:putative flippase GtrA
MQNEEMTHPELKFSDRVFALAGEHRHEAKRFTKFAIVGAIGAVVDFSVLNLLILVFGVEKFYANLASVACAIVSNFWWNRHWTFPESRDHDLHISFGKFAAVNLVGLGINQIVFLLTDEFIFTHFLPHPFDYNFAKAAAIGLVLFWNFFVNRFWTYRDI